MLSSDAARQICWHGHERIAHLPMRPTSGWKQIAAAVVGNSLDWYDFTLFGYMAPVIARQIFPPSLGWGPLFSTFTVFAISFFVRPIGGVIVGYCADVYGRRSVLLTIIGLMSVGTALICFAPSYASAGVISPLMILVARLLQGLGAGGEFATATSFLVEHAPQGSRGHYGGWQLAGQGLAIAAAGLLAGLTSHVLTAEQFDSWGWRLPFLCGLLIVPVGAYLRVRAIETPEFVRQASSADKAATSPHIMHFKLRLLVGLGLVIGGTAAFYALFIFMPTYAQLVLGLDVRSSFIGPVAAGLAIAALCPTTGALSDRLGARRLMVVGAALSLVALYPAFVWLQASPSVAKLLVVELVFGLCISIYGGPFSTTIAELFPVAIRATALSITYNVGVAAFGGLAPLIVARLLSVTGNSLAPAYYVMGCMGLSLIAAICLPTAASSAYRKNGEVSRSGRNR